MVKNKFFFFFNKYGTVHMFVRTLFYKMLLKNIDFSSAIDIGSNKKSIFADYCKINNKKCVTLDNDKSTNPDIVGDVLRMPIKDNAFDLAFASMIIEHVDHYKLMEEIARVSKKYCVIITLKPCKNFWDTLDHIRPYTIVALERLLAQYGFRAIKKFDLPFVDAIAVVGEKSKFTKQELEKLRIKGNY